MSNLDQDATTPTITITLDCADPARLAHFWTEALGYQEIATVDNFIVLGPAPGAAGTNLGGAAVPWVLALQGVPEPRALKNRMHIDLWVADIETEAARLEGLGAKRLQEKPFDEHGFRWFQLGDPEGNEFCVACSS
jgi:catechol 2,3-dioxygenase-like lactoylglutathione lyase family enzyme